jgi:anti-sigma regulatory factor (Ser/Thr protein kinase)
VERVTEREFAGDLSAPSSARGFALETLAAIVDTPSPTLREDVALVVSELVTNSVRAGSPKVWVTVAPSESGTVTIRVTDAADGWPQPRDADIHDVGGRGLALVSAVARTWGVRMDDATKTVWAELTDAAD